MPTPWQAGAPGVQASALRNSCCRGPALRPRLPGWSLQRTLLYLHVGLLPITSTTGPWKGVSPPPSLPCSQDPGEAVRPGSPDGHSGCPGQSWVTLPFTHHGAGGISLLPIPGGMDGALWALWTHSWPEWPGGPRERTMAGDRLEVSAPPPSVAQVLRVCWNQGARPGADLGSRVSQAPRTPAGSDLSLDPCGIQVPGLSSDPLLPPLCPQVRGGLSAASC